MGDLLVLREGYLDYKDLGHRSCSLVDGFFRDHVFRHYTPVHSEHVMAFRSERWRIIDM